MKTIALDWCFIAKALPDYGTRATRTYSRRSVLVTEISKTMNWAFLVNLMRTSRKQSPTVSFSGSAYPSHHLSSSPFPTRRVAVPCAARFAKLVGVGAIDQRPGHHHSADADRGDHLGRSTARRLLVPQAPLQYAHHHPEYRLEGASCRHSAARNVRGQRDQGHEFSTSSKCCRDRYALTTCAPTSVDKRSTCTPSQQFFHSGSVKKQFSTSA
jgi:hypothetical protein